MTALNVITGLTTAGFLKCTVVNRSYQVTGASDQTAVPKAWTDASGATINENQELKDDWIKKADKGSFAFYGKKWGLHGQDNTATNLNLSRARKNPSDNNMCLVYDRGDHWIVAAGQVKGPMEQKCPKGYFKSYYAANEAFKAVLDANGWEDDE